MNRSSLYLSSMFTKEKFDKQKVCYTNSLGNIVWNKRDVTVSLTNMQKT